MSEHAYPPADYAGIARAYWQQCLPARYAAVSAPGAFFAALGAQASREVAGLWARMAAECGNPPGEDFTERVGRLNALRKRAEEVVLAGLVFLPPEPGAGPD